MESMTYRSRQTIFYLLVLAFFVLGGSVVGYSQGLRLDLSTLRITRVGAIYVRSFPKESNIYVDDKEIKNESWLLQNGTLVNNLFPKTYKLTLTAPGYKDWHRTIAVQESFVSEIKFATLVPANPTEIPLPSPLRDFWIVGENAIITKGESSPDILFADKKLIGTSVVAISPTDAAVITKNASGSPAYALNNLHAGVAQQFNITAVVAKNSGETPVITFDEFDPTTILVMTSQALATITPGNAQTTPLSSSSSVIFPEQQPTDGATTSTTASSSAGQIKRQPAKTNTAKWVEFTGIPKSSALFVAWAAYDHTTKKSAVFLYDKFLGRVNAVPALFEGKIKKMDWTDGSTIAVLQEDKQLYTVSTLSGKKQLVQPDVEDFTFTDIGKKVAIRKRYDISVISFDDEHESASFSLPQAESVKKIVWYKDNNHLLVIYPQKTVFLDTKDKNMENVQVAAETGEAIYAPAKNELYYAHDGKLLRLDFPEN